MIILEEPLLHEDYREAREPLLHDTLSLRKGRSMIILGLICRRAKGGAQTARARAIPASHSRRGGGIIFETT